MFETHPAPFSSDSAVPELPKADRLVATQMTTELERLYAAEPGSDAAPPSHAESFAIIVPFLEGLLDDLDDAPPTLLAQLVVIAAMPSLAQAIALQIAFGRRMVEEHARTMARLNAQARQRNLSVDDYVAQLSAADAMPHDITVRLFRGESRRSPDFDRVRHGVALLRRTASLTPDRFRLDLLCMLAWLCWARGQRALAESYAAAAARIEPDHILAYGVTWLITSRVPTWLAGGAVTSPRSGASMKR